jgi:hypothetical protein
MNAPKQEVLGPALSSISVATDMQEEGINANSTSEMQQQHNVTSDKKNDQRRNTTGGNFDIGTIGSSNGNSISNTSSKNRRNTNTVSYRLPDEVAVVGAGDGDVAPSTAYPGTIGTGTDVGTNSPPSPIYSSHGRGGGGSGGSGSRKNSVSPNKNGSDRRTSSTSSSRKNSSRIDSRRPSSYKNNKPPHKEFTQPLDLVFS